MEWDEWLSSWSFWLLVYAVPGILFTEIAMRLAEKGGYVTPKTHPALVRFLAYIVHFTFWPLFVITALYQPFKKGR